MEISLIITNEDTILVSQRKGDFDMFVVNRDNNRIQTIKSNSFSNLGFGERKHLQEWLANNTDAFGEDLLIIQKEFDGFNDTKERLDLLAIDKQGDLVIIENKLDNSGRDVTWQVLKYASYCSSLTKQQVREIYQAFLSKEGSNDDAAENISEFLNVENFSEIQLNRIQRIILVAGNFRKEVTSTVLWLLTNYNLRIQCFKATPFQFRNDIFLNIEQIIPVKEVEDYTIRMAEKTKDEHKTQDKQVAYERLRLDFWKQLLLVMNKNSQLFSNINPSKANWISAGSGISGVGYAFVVSKQYVRAELYIGRSNAEENKYIFDKLMQEKNKVESKIPELVWERLDNKKASRIKCELQNISIYENDRWSEIIGFLTKNMLLIESIFKNYLTPINVDIKNRSVANK